MVTVPPDYNAHAVEGDSVSLWKARRLPPSGGVLGPPTGPVVRQFEGAWAQGDFPSLVAQRAVAADADARYLALVGRRAVGTLRQAAGPAASPTVPALLTALGVWTGGDGKNPWDSEDRTAGVQTIVGRLASKGILITRDESLRVCPSCGTPRSPERIIYDEQEADTFLVRFSVRVGERAVKALVWVDVPWKLLGTSALLVNPEIRYVVADYRRREDHELVLTSSASLDRLRSWIPEAAFEVVEERAGKEFQGIPYTYPLRHEFPMGGDLTAPGGTILAAPDVSETGTGIVPLVPGHGPTDAQIAGRFGVAGWPLVTPKGRLDFTLLHKYAGLDLDSANEFVLRDLSEAGELFARLRVKRGVPYCVVCGTALLWAPGRTWCLEPTHLPAERRALFSRLLPQETWPSETEVAPWPVSEATVSDEAGSVALLECARCERLEAPEGPAQCPCGGQRGVIRRKLLPSSAAAFAAWARFDPFPDGDSVHLYVGHRRRVPALVNHLAALSGVVGYVSDVNLTVVPTVAGVDVPDLVATHGADAVRAALIRSGLTDSSGGRLADRSRQEADRIRRWWSLSREVAAMCDSAMLAAFARPIGGFLGELEVEDRAILARWERTRTLALAHYDHWAPALVHRHACRFLDNDLVDYRELVQPRLALAGTPTTKRGALRTLVHLVRSLAEVLAPILPFTSEAVHRALSADRTSLFDQPMGGLDRSLLSDELVAAWDRWWTVLTSVDRFRRSLGVPRTTVLPSVVLVLPADDVGDRFRAEKETLARLARIQRLAIASPHEPWTGRQRKIRPAESEIQKAYPSQASQIVHLLRRMPPRRWETALGQEELTVVIDGLPRRVFPNMVAFSDTLPDRVVPIPWSLGEMYAEFPAGTAAANRLIPPLSTDAFWLVRRLERRLRAAPPSSVETSRIALVTAKDPLASELRGAADAISRYLGLRELRVVPKAEEAVPPTAMTGRTRTGDRWWVHIPDLPARRLREKRPRLGARLQRVSVSLASSSATTGEVDYADEKFVAHEEEVRALGQQLDDIIGVPLLGPSKIAIAWEQGLHSVEDLRRSSFDVVSAWPGFGGPVAEVVVSRLGGSVPLGHARQIRRPPAIPPPSRVEASPPEPLVGLSARLSPQAPAAAPPAVEPTFVSPPRVLPLEPPIAPPSPPEPEPAKEVSLVPVVPQTPAAEEIPPAPPPETIGETGELPASEEVKTEPFPVESPAESATVSPEATTPPVETPPLEETVLPAETPPFENLTRSDTEEASLEPPAPLEETPTPPLEGPPPEEAASVGEPAIAPSPPLIESVTAPEIPPPEVIETPEPSSAEPVETIPAAPGPAESEPPAAESLPTEPSELLPPPTDEPSAEVTTEPTPEAEPTPPVEAGPPVSAESETVSPAPVAEREPMVMPEEEGAPASQEIAAEPATIPVTEGIEPSAPPEPEPAPAAPPPPLTASAPSLLPESSLPLPAPAPPEPEPPPPPSGVELTVGDSLVSSLGGFLESTAAGHHGVCVVRESPERIRARVGPRPIEVLWLTNIGRGPALRPSDLEGAWAFLTRKLVEEHVTAFFLEGIEYLVRLHGADAVLNGLVEFDRLARENDARIWVCLTPALMKAADFERFRATFGGGPSSP
jgi:hypothetical protein